MTASARSIPASEPVAPPEPVDDSNPLPRASLAPLKWRISLRIKTAMLCAASLTTFQLLSTMPLLVHWETLGHAARSLGLGTVVMLVLTGTVAACRMLNRQNMLPEIEASAWVALLFAVPVASICAGRGLAHGNSFGVVLGLSLVATSLLAWRRLTGLILATPQLELWQHVGPALQSLATKERRRRGLLAS